MSQEYIQGVVSWNVNCQADPGDQIYHLDGLERQMRDDGAQTVLLCLSEVTAPLVRPEENTLSTLQEVLLKWHYNSNLRHTSIYKDRGRHLGGLVPAKNRNRFEGMGFASRDEVLAAAIGEASFVDTAAHRARRTKTAHWRQRHRHQQRRVASVMMGDISVFTTHASQNSPGWAEREAILRAAGPVTAGEKKVLVGDFQYDPKNRFGKEAAERGWVELKNPSRRATWRGLALDRAFGSPALADSCQMEIGARGPSDHAPLLLYIGK